MNNTTPLWLDLKKEYIDDNFEKLLPYLREAGNRSDSFYETTIGLMRQRVRILEDEIADSPLPTDEESLDSRAFNVRLLAAWLLVGNDDGGGHRTFLAMLGELRHLVPKFSEELLNVALCSLRFEKVADPGVKWDDLLNFSPEIFTYKVINQYRCIVPRMKDRWWTGYGSVCQTKDCMWVSPELDEKSVKTLESKSVSIDESHGIKVLSAGKEKLKQSQQNDISAISDFLDSFIAEMKNNLQKKKAKSRLLAYSDGDAMNVRITALSDDAISVETTDPGYDRLSGKLVFGMKSLLYYYKSMFHKWFEVGDVIPAHLKDVFLRQFTIDRTFVDFIVADTKENYMELDYLSKLIDTSQHEYVWLNSCGIPVYTEKDTSYSKGDFAYTNISACCTGKFHGKINGTIVECTDETFDENEVRKECLRAFVKDVEDKNAPVADTTTIEPVIIRLLIRHLFAHQKHLLKPSERTRFLAVARIFAEMQQDEKASSYIDFAGSYLCALVLFSRDEDLSGVKMKIPEGSEDSRTALVRMSVFQLLRLWGKPGYDESLMEYAKEFEEKEPVVSRIARIIQTSNSMREIVTGASLNMLRREIVKTLQLETIEESDLESDSGAYLGVESGSVEFKESVVFPPDGNMLPNESRQIRNVLKGICAFLNSQTGGTLYVGVSDQGYVKGIQKDLDFLNCSADTYMRVHIQDPAKQLLGLDAIAYMKMELMYDEQVVAIRVDPYPYRIVELDGKAYLRINAESREMTDFMKQQMLSRKVFTHQELAANLSMLQQSIQNQKQVVLHRYSSSNSGTVSDRTVEAYDIFADSNIVVCLDTKDMKCKCFNLSRIGYVEILDKPWANRYLHQTIKVDAFHMSGERQIDCCLDLDLMAYNLLCEEYPRAKDELTKSKETNHWILNARVYNVAGIARFVAGLANHIRIIQAPELKAYLKEYASTSLADMMK